MALDDGLHHRRLASGPERRAPALPRLDRDQPVDDLAALHEGGVDVRIDAVDLDTEIGEGFMAGSLGICHGRLSRLS